jgi:pimeloyl-ACP methyl ester carboxylesterase
MVYEGAMTETARQDTARSNGERLVAVGGVQLCVETFGDAGNPAVLLIHGACASMLWWPAELCERIAAGGRHVVRYDNRDTGRSTCYPPGRPGYALTDLAADAIGILDALDVPRAHVVGRSMAGAVALILAIDHPDRVATLTLVGTTPGGDDLPPMSAEFRAATAEPPDTTHVAAVVAAVVGMARAYAGRSPHFDEDATRALAEQDVARARNVASTLANHFAIELDGPARGPADVTAPTLVVHGELDPVFPLPHGEALCRAVPGAELLVLADTGHDVPPPVWDGFVAALLRHTAARDGGAR